MALGLGLLLGLRVMLAHASRLLSWRGWRRTAGGAASRG
jgi:hypothetical protein